MSEDQREDKSAELKDQAAGVSSALVKTGILTSGSVSAAIASNSPGVAAALMIGAGAVLASELVSVVIPNFKQKRFDKFAADLQGRVDALEEDARERAESRAASPEFADLFEDGARQAVRALSDERIEHIVNVLENSLTSEEMEHARRKRLLELLGQVNDVELLLLQGRALHYPEDREFWQKHRHLRPEPLHFGVSQEKIDNSIIFDSYEQHMEELGLLKRRYQKPSGKASVEFDFSTGQIKSSGYDITGIGRLLLHEIGLKEPMREQRKMEE